MDKGLWLLFIGLWITFCGVMLLMYTIVYEMNIKYGIISAIVVIAGIIIIVIVDRSVK